MMLMPVLKPFALAAALVVTAGASVAAPLNPNAFDVSKQVSNNFFGTNGSRNATIVSTDPSVNQGVAAGGFAVKGDLDGLPGTAAQNFTAWCVDIARALSLTSKYKITDLPFASNALAGKKDNIDRLFETGYDPTKLGQGTTDAGKDYSAGFQIALWEIVFENTGTFNVNAGSFKVTGAANAREVAKNLLLGLGNATGNKWKVVYLESQNVTGNDNLRDSQHLLTPVPVPLPAAGLMLLAALGGLGLMRRRRRMV